MDKKKFSSKTFVTETVNEFGDKTGNMKVGIIATGYFSNSATSNSCAELIISIMKNRKWYDLYEYCGNHSSDDCFDIEFIGMNTHTSVNTNSISYEFIELCKDNDTIYVKMNETGRYVTTKAVFKFFECKKLYKLYIETFGQPNMIAFSKNGDYLRIYKNLIPEGEINVHIPNILCNKAHDYYGSHFNNGVRLDGRFKNNEDIFLHGTNIIIDGKKPKTDGYLENKIDFNWFIENIQVGSIIKVEYEYDSTIYEEIVISKDQYDALVGFFNN